jgi:Fic family protein
MRYLDKQIKDRIDSKLSQLNKLRPLPPSAVAKLKEQFAIEMTYNSNAIEGNKLTLKETFLVISEGITIKGRSLKDHLEAKDHYEALNFLYDLVEHGKQHTISEVLIRSIQQLVVKDTDPQVAGKYRTGNVIITGSSHKPPEAVEVPGLMRDALEWFRQNIGKLHSIEAAAILHHKITYVHPFGDGNGRTARLIMNLILMQKGYPLVVILKNDRKKYYQTLSKADKGDHAPFIRFLAQAVERSMSIYLNALLPTKEKGEKYYSLSVISKHTPYSEKYLNLLARTGKIDAHKEGRNWVTSLDAIKQYQVNRQRKRRSL